MHALRTLVAIGLLAGCARPFWIAAPLTLEEKPYIGCYNVLLGPWPDSTKSFTELRMQLDSLRSPYGRGLRVLSARRKDQPFAYWAAVSQDSLAVRIGRGVEGQGLELRLRAVGDSIDGMATNHIWVNEAHTASVRGARFQCPAG